MDSAENKHFKSILGQMFELKEYLDVELIANDKQKWEIN